jgi:hypothetical protein
MEGKLLRCAVLRFEGRGEEKLFCGYFNATFDYAISNQICLGPVKFTALSWIIEPLLS